VHVPPTTEWRVTAPWVLCACMAVFTVRSESPSVRSPASCAGECLGWHVAPQLTAIRSAGGATCCSNSTHDLLKEGGKTFIYLVVQTTVPGGAVSVCCTAD
jgi:hypothetical protein